MWAVRRYDDIDPIVFSVDEADEISIGDVANLVLVIRSIFCFLKDSATVDFFRALSILSWLMEQF